VWLKEYPLSFRNLLDNGPVHFKPSFDDLYMVDQQAFDAFTKTLGALGNGNPLTVVRHLKMGGEITNTELCAKVFDKLEQEEKDEFVDDDDFESGIKLWSKHLIASFSGLEKIELERCDTEDMRIITTIFRDEWGQAHPYEQPHPPPKIEWFD